MVRRPGPCYKSAGDHDVTQVRPWSTVRHTHRRVTILDPLDRDPPRCQLEAEIPVTKQQHDRDAAASAELGHAATGRNPPRTPSRDMQRADRRSITKPRIPEHA